MNRIATIKGNALLLNGIATFIAFGLYGLVFRGIWDVRTPEPRPGSIPILILLLGLMVVHKGIHWVAALLIVDRRKIGFRASWLALVCKVNALMTRRQYFAYALAPAVLLGQTGIALYYAPGTVEQQFLAALLSLGGVSSGGGDFWFVYRILRFPRGSLVLDKGIAVEIFETGFPA
jgi:hypothetical protein